MTKGDGRTSVPEPITNRNLRPDGTPMSFPFRIPAHRMKVPVPFYMCPDHGVTLGRGEWTRMVMDLTTGITRLHFICAHLERVTVEEHPDNTVLYHRAPKVRPRWKAPITFYTDGRD